VTPSEVVAELALATKDAIAVAVAPLLERIAVLEAKAAQLPRDAEVDLDVLALKAAALIPVPLAGRDGKDAPVVDLDALAVKAAARVPSPAFEVKSFDSHVHRVLDERLMSLTPKDGKDGRDGQNIDPELVRKFIAEEVAKIPAPRDGKDGRDVDAAMLETIVSATVDRVLSGWTRPTDGKSLTPEDVAPLIAAEVTKAVSALPKAKDGKGIHDVFITREGELALTFSDGGREKVGVVVGAPGAPGKDADMELLKKHAEDIVARIPLPKDGEPGKDGKDGADGLGIEDLDLVLDETKGFVFRWANGPRVKEQAIPLPVERGTYRVGVFYHKYSLVTAQGSYWMALQDTADKPGESKAWRLVVKRGRDGKDARPADA